MKNVEISFTLTDRFERHSLMIEKAAGRECDSSGAGFGQRDMQFTGLEESEAQIVAESIKRLGIPGLTVAVMDGTYGDG